MTDPLDIRFPAGRRVVMAGCPAAGNDSAHVTGGGIMELKTDEALLRALKVASSRKLTADELHKQRVSYIMGTLKETSGVTRDQVERALAEREGRRPA